jgi:hypothetical protein
MHLHLHLHLHLRSGTKLRKWMRCVLFFAQLYQVWGTRSPNDYSYSNSKCICAKVLNCANGCAVYYFCVLAGSHTKFGEQGLPRTIATTLTHKRLNRTSNFGNNISMYVYCVQMHLHTLVAERKCICALL